MSPGTGTMTPVTPGAPTGMEIAQPLPFTLLPLAKYAAILGISPVHFQGAYSDSIFPLTNSCPDVWPRYSWQAVDRVSHYDLALAIANAEQDLADYMGWWAAPMWVAQEAHPYPRFHRADTYSIGGYNVRGMHKSIRTAYGKVISPGQRAVTLIATATTVGGSLAYTDEDGDGFTETATITVATTLDSSVACDIKVYFADTDGEQEWEIRPARSKVITGGNAVLIFDAWLFIDPDLQSAYPTPDGFAGIELVGASSYVASVDVYYEHNDATADSAIFYWEPDPSTIGVVCSICGGTGCAVCQLTEQDGCFHIRNPESGVVVPVPGTYSLTDAEWASATWAVCRDPDIVKLYYYCGALDNRYLSGRTCDPLSYWWSEVIAMLATARLERPFCSCGNSVALAEHWRLDLALAGQQSHQLSPDIIDNPFGTRRGEVIAWQRVSRLAKNRTSGVAAI